MNKLSARDIRQRFLDYFQHRDHTLVPSASLVPRTDPTLLFTNAGMNQFKSVFVGEERRDYVKAVSSQKCVRAGGKHNDLENVGRTARHHTFFEMLGNFSFGDYFKKEAIRYAWEFITEDLKIPKERLYASVFREDDEAFSLWENDIGIEKSRIYRFGEKDNFWSMGETGPCGPCSEIFYDQGTEVGCGQPDCAVGCECDRYVEIWNLVFMEFNQKSDGTREKLPEPSVDTGMGLERLAAVVQGVTSNFDTDLFTPLIDRIGSLCGKKYDASDESIQISMRVIADHIRAMTLLISDGIVPSNEGRGYVLRRVMRRAMRHGRALGLNDPFLCDLSATVVKTLGDFFKELNRSASTVATVIRQEEERFSQTIDRGLALLSEEMESLKKTEKKMLDGTVAFRLYDTYGFPIDMTVDILRDSEMTVDLDAYDEAFARHREKARGSWKGSSTKAIDALVRQWVADGFRTEFLGYEGIITEGEVFKLVKDGKEVSSAKAGHSVELISTRTPFYGESGGQVGDIGGISGDGFSLEVIDTKKPAPEVIVHDCKVTEGEIQVGAKATFGVNRRAREATMKNHTATHMLHSALKEILGSHVQQSGSMVAPERLRFDFTHPKAVSGAEIATIEQQINERIWCDTKVKKEVLPYDDAMASGAIALFDEKYGKEVRVVSLADYSKELCGGTHLDRTGEIGLFKVVKEGSVAAGIRRLEAFTGHRALRYVQDTDHKLREAGTLLGASTEEVTERIAKLLEKQKELKKKASTKGSNGKGAGKEKIEKIKGIKVLTLEAQDTDQRELRDLADRFQEQIKSGIVVVGSKVGKKAFLVVKVSKDLSKKYPAGKLIKPAAELLGGSGGGRPEMAQAGGPHIDKLKTAMTKVGSALK